MDKRIKVLHILWSGGIGGTEEYVTSLIRYFDSSKYEIHLCFLSKKGVIFEEAIKMHENTVFIGMNGAFDIVGFLKFYIYLHKSKFDIIHSHCHNILANIACYFFKGSKKVYTSHLSPGDLTFFLKKQKRKLFYKLFFKSFQTVIAISKGVRRYLAENMGVNPNKIVVIYNGIDVDKYNQFLLPAKDLLYAKNSNKKLLGFIGRMESFKRPDLFISVAVEIIKRKKEFYFIMVGDGPELPKCKKMISDYGISDYFKLLGFRRDIPNILKLFDALFFPSSGEGFGIVILETMAMGIPVFAINDGAISEIVIHKENSILLDTVDSEVIAKQIIEYLEEESLMEKIKEKCVAYAHSKFSIKLCAKKIEEIYAETLRER